MRSILVLATTLMPAVLVRSFHDESQFILIVFRISFSHFCCGRFSVLLLGLPASLCSVKIRCISSTTCIGFGWWASKVTLYLTLICANLWACRVSILFPSTLLVNLVPVADLPSIVSCLFAGFHGSRFPTSQTTLVRSTCNQKPCVSLVSSSLHTGQPRSTFIPRRSKFYLTAMAFTTRRHM